MTKISILLPTYNCENTIEHTLKSIEWADEILVIDSFSNDNTLTIVKKFGAKVFQHEYINSAKQKNWALKFVSNDWVLQIDSDETLEKGLREEIYSNLSDVSSRVHCFQIPRKNYVLGRWKPVCNLYPDYQTRLFKKDFARFADKEVHAKIICDGDILTLNHHIIHKGMPHISKQLSNLDRYARYEADELLKNNYRLKITDILFKPFGVFILKYFFQGGYKFGMRGLILSLYNYTYVLFKYLKYWEIKELGLKRSPKT